MQPGSMQPSSMQPRAVTIRDSMLFFEKAPVALLAIDTTLMRVVAANERAAQWLGLSEPQYALSDLLPPTEMQRFLDLLRSQAVSAELENSSIRRPNGAARDADISFSRLSHGSLAILAVHDSSAREHLEEQLRQSQKMEALGMLASGIAHDFNNLLTIISGYSQMLHSGPSTGELDRSALNEVLKACDHAAGLTAQLLAFSRRQAVTPQPIDINLLLEETSLLLRRLIGEQNQLRIVADPDAGFIHADPGQIRQVVLNLAINARDAMPQGGSLTIRTGRVDSATGSQVLLEVSDTGEGMGEATRRRLFEPFFTTKPPGRGTGLGLATVHRIVKHFGGHIEVASAPGQGASFRVFLPRVAEAAERKTAPSAAASGGHETILLVEDDTGVRSMMRTALQKRGYRVLAAADGAEAIETERAQAGPIALLVTDIVMPGMSGSTLAELLRERRPGLPVLYISGYPDAGDDPRESWLQKPFAPGALTARVREILDGSATARAASRR